MEKYFPFCLDAGCEHLKSSWDKELNLGAGACLLILPLSSTAAASPSPSPPTHSSITICSQTVGLSASSAFPWSIAVHKRQNDEGFKLKQFFPDPSNLEFISKPQKYSESWAALYVERTIPSEETRECGPMPKIHFLEQVKSNITFLTSLQRNKLKKKT